MVTYLLIPVILLVSACTCNPTKEVRVPIQSDMPLIETPDRPILSIKTITDEDSDEVVLSKYELSIRQLILYSNTLEILIDNYNSNRYISPEKDKNNAKRAAD